MAMTKFQKAFAKARKDNPGKPFEFEGKMYSTRRKDENRAAQKMGSSKNIMPAGRTMKTIKENKAPSSGGMGVRTNKTASGVMSNQDAKNQKDKKSGPKGFKALREAFAKRKGFKFGKKAGGKIPGYKHGRQVGSIKGCGVANTKKVNKTKYS